MIEVEIADRQRAQPVDFERLRAAITRVVQGEGFQVANVSVAVVGHAEMHELNRRHLGHDYPTDVLSFVFERSEDSLEGEIVLSADYAAEMAVQCGWSSADEQLLYAIHGALHLCGHDDASDAERAAMRELETHYLASFGIERRDAPQ